jgi:outer membrane protein TolC
MQSHLETLEQAWATALTVDQRLEAKRWSLSSSEASLRSAQAQRWPTVGLEGSYVVRSDEPAFKFEFSGIPLPTNTFRYAQDENFAFRTKVDFPLYTSGRIRHGIAAAAANVVSAELEVEDSVNDLKLRVAEEYMAVLRARRHLEVAQSSVKSLKAHARDVEMLFRHDQVPNNDLLAAQVALANARQRAIQAHNQLDGCRAAYNRRLGRSLTLPVRLAELPAEKVDGDVDSLTAHALRTRPAVAHLVAQVRALRHQADSLLATNHPQVKLRGEYAFEENRFRTPEGLASVGVGVYWNVFDGGRNRHEAAALLRRAEGLRRLQADLESMIALEVRRAWLDIQETRCRLAVTREATQRAEENLRVAKKCYALGMGTSTEVLDAQTLRTEAYQNHHQATYDAVLAVLRLRHATGQMKR